MSRNVKSSLPICLAETGTTHTPPDSNFHHLDTLQVTLLSQMRHYLTLNLRIDQKRTDVHSKTQQDQYIDCCHGPSYECIEDWNRRLGAAQLQYQNTNRKSKSILSGDIKVEESFLARVMGEVGELEDLLEEIG